MYKNKGKILKEDYAPWLGHIRLAGRKAARAGKRFWENPYTGRDVCSYPGRGYHGPNWNRARFRAWAEGWQEETDHINEEKTWK